MSKTHARDYLLEMADAPTTAGWMRDLIVRVVNSNGQLTEDDLAQTTAQLKANGVGVLEMPTAISADAAVEISLSELIHHSGVNALASEQKIPFSKDITLLYGCNGTGKSSYFRILNEMVGGNREIHVHHNIFTQTPAPINVELKYKVKVPRVQVVSGVQVVQDSWEDKSVSWNGTGRAFAPLTQASVFDSDYTNDLLEKRSADTAIVKPLGLHLFTALTSAMDAIRDRLGTEIDGITRGLPQIPQDNLGQVIKTILYRREYSAEQKRYITSCYTMSPGTQKALEDSEKAYKELMSKDFEANIKVAEGERYEVVHLTEHLRKCDEDLKKFEEIVGVIFSKVKAARAAQAEARMKIKVLGEIGNTDSKEWLAFIQSGAAYAANATIPAGTCPYCRQPLQGNALGIVKAYGDFLGDKTAAAFNAAIKEKNECQNHISHYITEYALSEQLLKVLNVQENSDELKEYVVNNLSQYEEIKKALLTSFEHEGYQPQKFPEGNGMLRQIVFKYDKELRDLRAARTGKEEQLKKLNETRLVLLEHQAIAAQRTLWEQWFAKVEQSRELERCQQKLSTRGVSTLSKQASQHLLTDSLRQKFQEELDALKMGYLEVSLDEDGASRGQSYMKIKLPSAIRTQEILSEGEQKGVALALFIAERRMEQVKNPIILDDPVNSLDHHITALLMERLVELGNQVVIFSHHILLRDSLLALKTVHECNKTQINGCGKQSKHLFLYNVNARDAKGYIRDSKQDNARYYIEEARRVIDKPDFDEATDMGYCSGLLRQAIEHMVDEKVFKNLVPVKYRGGKNQTIIWDRLKELQADPALIDMLHNYFNRVSGGNLHVDQESRENPVDWAELNQMCAQLFAAL